MIDNFLEVESRNILITDLIICSLLSFRSWTTFLMNIFM